MTDDARTPTQADEQAQGAQAEQANAENSGSAGDQDQTESQGLFSKIADAAKNAASTVVEAASSVAGAVADRMPDVAENVVGAAKHLVGREHTHTEDGTTVETTDADTAQATSDAGAEQSTAEASDAGAEQATAQADQGAEQSTAQADQEATSDEQSTSVAETVADAAQAATDQVRRVGARVYGAIALAVGSDQPQGGEAGQGGEAEQASAEAGATAGASFEPTEDTTKGGKPRRFKDVQPGMQLEGKVTSIALYGVFIDVGVGRDGLVHISEMSDTRIEAPTDLVQIGDPVTVWVKSVDTDARRISLTMRDPNRPKPQRERRGPRKPEVDRDRLSQLKPNDTIEGMISSLAPFGAFVDIGVGKDGLVHISELAEGRVDKPEDAVQVGERYTFKVLEVDPEGKRISLSLRRALRSQRMQQLEPGTLLDGTVSGLAPFGAFVDVGVGRDGLVHISELSDQRVGSVEEAVKVGDKVQVKVIEVDPNSKRISLTMRVEEPLPNERPRPAGVPRNDAGYAVEGDVAAPAFQSPSFGGDFTPGGDRSRGGDVRGGDARGRGGDVRGGDARGRGGDARGRGGDARGRGRDAGGDVGGRGGRLGGRPEGRGGRREGQIYEPAEEVYTFEDPEEETFSGDATLADLVSKFNAGKDRRKTRRDFEEEEEEGKAGGRRDAIRRTLAMRDEE
jgi:predicted RNA-binding protein with RPS1 domain